MPAIGYGINPGIFTALPAVVEIETRSVFAEGQTAADWDAAEPNAMICLNMGADALTVMFTERLCQGNAQATEPLCAQGRIAVRPRLLCPGLNAVGPVLGAELRC